MSDDTTITIRRVGEPDELFCHFPGQSNSQDVYLYLDPEDGELSCSYSTAIGSGMPMRVWRGTLLRWQIPALTAEAANKLMEQVVPLARRVVDGHVTDWDGSNHVGYLTTEDAEVASEEIQAACDPNNYSNWDPSDMVGGCSASDWWPDAEHLEDLGISASTSDAEIAEIARREEVEARYAGDNGYTVLVDAEDFLRRKRDDLRDDDE